MNINTLKLNFKATTVLTVGFILALVSVMPPIVSAQELGRVRSYVAIGDSVASGLGLAPIANATAEDSLCGRSSGAYSAIVAQQLKDNAYYQNFACQGARVTHLSTAQPVGGTNIEAQLDAAFSDGTPNLISLTIGANDAQWSTFIGACYATDCNTDEFTQAGNFYLAQLNTSLNSALTDIESRSQGNPPAVIVSGYYEPMSMNCVGGPITAGEVTWVNNESKALSNTIKSATENFSFATFAPIDFTGHDICSANPWIQRPGFPGEPAAFHPNSAGQQAMAQAVLTAAGNSPILENN